MRDGRCEEAHASLGSITWVAGWVAAAPGSLGGLAGLGGTQPVRHEAGRVMDPARSRHPRHSHYPRRAPVSAAGVRGLVGAWGCSSAGRGDRGEISRGQKRFAGAGSAEVEAAHSRRAPICGFQDPWAFRCRGQPSQRGRAPLGELGGSRLTPCRKKGKK